MILNNWETNTYSARFKMLDITLLWLLKKIIKTIPYVKRKETKFWTDLNATYYLLIYSRAKSQHIIFYYCCSLLTIVNADKHHCWQMSNVTNKRQSWQISKQANLKSDKLQCPQTAPLAKVQIWQISMWTKFWLTSVNANKR